MLVDKEKLIATVERASGLRYKDYKNFTEEQKNVWRYNYNYHYSLLRKERKHQMSKMFLQDFNTGYMQEFFNKYGLNVWNNQVRFTNCGSPILKSYLQTVVIPAMEKELNIKGVKIKNKHVSGMSSNLFDWDRAEIIEDKK